MRRSFRCILPNSNAVADELKAMESDKEIVESEMEQIQNDRIERLDWIRRSLEAIQFGIIADNRDEQLYSEEELKRISFVQFLHRHRGWSY